MRIELDMYQTMAVAVLALMLGRYLRKKCWLLERFCIPAPVIGGVIFAVATCICYVTGIAEFVFDNILKEVLIPAHTTYVYTIDYHFIETGHLQNYQLENKFNARIAVETK